MESSEIQSFLAQAVAPGAIALASAVVVYLILRLQTYLLQSRKALAYKSTIDAVFDLVVHAVRAAEQTLVKRVKEDKGWKLSQWDGRAIRDEVCARAIEQLDESNLGWREGLNLSSDEKAKSLVITLIESSLCRLPAAQPQPVRNDTPIDDVGQN